LTGADRHSRPHRLPLNCILFGRIRWAGWDRAGYSVVRARSGDRRLVIFVARRQVAVTPLSPVGWLVRLRFRDSARWERTAFQIVNHIIVVIVIDDRRTITLPRIIALWRISLRWRIGLKRVVLRQSLPS
jgi:hypothetical protein